MPSLPLPASIQTDRQTQVLAPTVSLLTPVGSGDAVPHGIYLQLDEQIVVAGSSENASEDGYHTLFADGV